METNQAQTNPSQDIRFAEPTFIDPLTRLYNQYYLFHFLPQEIQKAKLGNYSLAVCMLDLDGFKNVNDAYGHLCGDEVLKQFAAIIKKSVRHTDMVIRYAGDEFTILLPGVDLQKVENLARQLIENVDKNGFKGTDGKAIHLTTSVGFSLYPEDAQEVNPLIERADKALYLSKQRGKNRVSRAQEVTLEEASSLVAMESFPCPKFIDRKEAIAALKDIFDAKVLQSHSLAFAFVSGEPGTGKSRLLNELNNYVQDRSVVITSRSNLTHKQDPYYLFAKGIGAYIEKIGLGNSQFSGILGKLPPEELIELSRIISPLTAMVKDPGTINPEDKRARFLLFKGFLDLLNELNNLSPLVLAFDDVQWADAASIELLKYVSKQDKNRRLLVACCFVGGKNQELLEESNFKDFWHEISTREGVSKIHLTNLSLEDTSQMIEAIFPGMGTNKEFALSLYTTTKGNPSFIEEVLKSLVENSVISYQEGRWQIKKDIPAGGIPFTVEEVIKKRIKNLDEETKEMIVQAAVIGEDFSIDFLKKINNRDEGLMFELLSRAKKMRLIDEVGEKGNFGFINKNIQAMLYSELDDEERNQLHYKIIQVLGQEHKDTLYNVAGEMAFHYSQTPLQERADEYSKALLEKTTQLFSPAEMMEYLDELTKEAAIGEGKLKALPNDFALNQLLQFLRAFLSAIKSYHLYPAGAMRVKAVKDAQSMLEELWPVVEVISLSEVEKSLIVNGERIPPKIAEQVSLDNFLDLMIEYNIKSLYLTKGVSQAELAVLTEQMSLPVSTIKETGGWQTVLMKAGLKCIRIEEARFLPSSEFSRGFAKKDKLKDIMLIEFLLGKIGHSGVDKKGVLHTLNSEPATMAKAIEDAAKEAIKEGKDKDEVKVVTDSIEKIHSQILDKDTGNDPQKLSRVILELEPELRNKVIRSQLQAKDSKQKDIAHTIINSLPEATIVETIVKEYKENQGNLLITKDYFDKAFGADEKRRKAAFTQLEGEMRKLKILPQEIDFIGGKQVWGSLSTKERLHTLTNLPDRYYSLELEKIRAFLDELSLEGKQQELETFVLHLLQKMGHLDPFIRRDILLLLTNFVKASLFNDAINSLKIKERLEIFWKILRTETDPKGVGNLLDILKEPSGELSAKLQLCKDIISEIERPEIKRYSYFVNELVYSLTQRLKEKGSLELCKLCEDFVKDIFQGKLLEILFGNIVNLPLEKRENLKLLLPLIQEKLVDTVIGVVTNKDIKWHDPFYEYTIKKGSAGLLAELGETAISRIRYKLMQSKQDVSLSLIELTRYMGKEALIDSLALYLRHKDYLVQRSTILAIGDIGGPKAFEALTKACKEERDKNVHGLLKEELKKLRTKK